MSELFLIEDLFNTLIAIEEYGSRTYQELSENVNDVDVRNLFLKLADQENKHEEYYKELKLKFNTSEEVTEEYQNYLRILLKHSVFKALNADVGDDIDKALDWAIGLEKETLIFINEVQTILGADAYDVFEEIKNQERQHLAYLLNIVGQRKEK